MFGAGLFGPEEEERSTHLPSRASTAPGLCATSSLARPQPPARRHPLRFRARPTHPDPWPSNVWPMRFTRYGADEGLRTGVRGSLRRPPRGRGAGKHIPETAPGSSAAGGFPGPVDRDRPWQCPGRPHCAQTTRPFRLPSRGKAGARQGGGQPYPRRTAAVPFSDADRGNRARTSPILLTSRDRSGRWQIRKACRRVRCARPLTCNSTGNGASRFVACPSTSG